MKIGIFGDSYSDPNAHSIPDNKLSWTNILKNKYSLDVTNFSRGCTSSFYSLMQLKENIKTFDTIVFVLTNSGRLYYPDSLLRLCNIGSIEEQLKIRNNPHAPIYEAAKQYYLYLDTPEFNQFIQDSVVKEVKALALAHNKKLLLIPGFFETLHYQTTFKTALQEISLHEQINVGGAKHRRMSEFEKPTMANHLLPINNERLAEKVFQLLTDKIDSVSLNDFDFSSCEDPNVYWDLSKL